MEISKCEMRPLSEEEITKLAEADTPAKVPNMERLQKIAEMYPADDNCVVMETLMQNINSQLETQDRRMIKEFLFDNLDIFATHKFDVGKVPHDKLNVVIEIGNRPVPCAKLYRLGEVRRNIMNTIISEMIKYDIIEESQAPGGAPALLVQKRDNTWRLVVNYIELNKICEKRCYPMPNVDDYINALRGFKYFSILDLANGYLQIDLAKKEREKTAFVTEDGKYQFKRLPMGLMDSPYYFQRLINYLMGNMKYTICLGYFDDLPIMGKTIQELINNNQRIFMRLREYNLKCNPKKCRWFITTIKFLGHEVTGYGVRPDAEKVKVFKNMQCPETRKQLQSQLGCFNYFSRFIKDYSKLSAPLYELLSKANQKFTFTDENKTNWIKLKEALIEDCLLVHFDPTKEVELMIDASDLAVGGVLLQKENSDWRPNAYFVQKLLKYQLSYTVTEKECLAVIIGVTKFRHYLEGKEFTIISDHHALCALMKAKYKLARLHRWAAILSIFRYKIEYLKGTHHPADCLSRPTEWTNKELEKDEGESNIIYEDDLLDCLLILNHDQAQIEVIKDKEEKWIDYTTRKDSIWYLMNQLGYKDHRYGHFQVLLKN